MHAAEKLMRLRLKISFGFVVDPQTLTVKKKNPKTNGIMFSKHFDRITVEVFLMTAQTYFPSAM